MPATVLLKDIAEALQMQFDESSSYLDLETGHVETVSHSSLHRAEEADEQADDLPDWEEEELELARQILTTDRFKKLPDKFDIHEWAIMEEFSRSVRSDRIRDDLLHAIHGAGAFRHFKAAVRRHRIESDWFAFRDEALTQIAREWCEENRVSWQ